MARPFDPYHRWLGIPPEEQPPNHYRLLAIKHFESEPDVIDSAADQRMNHLRTFQTGERATESQRLLNEVTVARLCLLDPGQREAYDAQLRQEMYARTAASAPPAPLPAGPQDNDSPPVIVTEAPRKPKSPKTRPGASQSPQPTVPGSPQPAPEGPRPAKRSPLPLLIAGTCAAVVLLAGLIWALQPRPRGKLVLDWPSMERGEVTLTIDGQPTVFPSNGPLEIPCQPGEHVIKARRPDYKDFYREVKVEAGKSKKIKWTWEPIRAAGNRVVVNWPLAERNGGELRLDGVLHDLSRERDPQIKLTVSSGTHMLTFSRPGFEIVKHEVAVALGEEAKVNLAWRPSAPPRVAPPPVTPPRVTPPVLPPLVTGQWADLLPHVDPVRHAVHGEWQRIDGGLMTNFPVARLLLPVVVDGDYELEFEFTRRAGNDLAGVVFPVGQESCLFCLGGWTNQKHALQTVDGTDARNGPATVPAVAPLENNRRYRALLTVTRPNPTTVSISGSLDGRQVLAWSGTAAAPTCLSGWWLPRLQQPALAAQQLTVFHQARLRVTKGSARWDGVADPTAPAAPRKIRPLGGGSGIAFHDLAPPGAVLVGLRYNAGRYVNRVQPIYRAANGQEIESSLRGVVASQPKLVAREGYAVGGLCARTGSWVDGIQLVYMRFDGKSLLPSDTYTSSWIGGGENMAAQRIVSDGTPVIGLWGASGVYVDALDLILGNPGGAPPKYEPTTPPPSLPPSSLPFVSLTTLQPVEPPRVSWSTFGVNTTTDKTPILSVGKVGPCREFLYAHANSQVKYALPKGARAFTAVGYCVASRDVKFQVFVDDAPRPLWESGRAGEVEVNVNLPAGAKTITLKINDLGNQNADNSFWCYPRLLLSPEKKIEQIAVPDDKLRDEVRARLAKDLKFDQAKSPESKATLARELIDAAEDDQGKPEERYVLWTVASELAAEANDAELAFAAVDQLALAFQASAAERKAAVLGRLPAVHQKSTWRERRERTGEQELVFWAALKEARADLAEKMLDDIGRLQPVKKLVPAAKEHRKRLELTLETSKGTSPSAVTAPRDPHLPWPEDGVLLGRTKRARQSLLRVYGGTDASEKAVEAALDWLAEHQFPDGSWTLDHGSHPNCNGQCTLPGKLSESRNGPTALALLAFLGAGRDRWEGRHRAKVDDGLQFLRRRAKRSGALVSWHEEQGNMYSHALATMAVCEAYALLDEKDEFKLRNDLANDAAGAVAFILEAQNPMTGGWRYNPREVGDTSVTGWQVSALKTAEWAGLLAHEKRLQPAVAKSLVGADRFLTSVQLAGGAEYKYDRNAQSGIVMNTVGVFTRLQLGTPPPPTAMTTYLTQLRSHGMSGAHVYFDYYGTQVLLRVGGKDWTAWNTRLRNHLVTRQETQGHPRGSWNFGAIWWDKNDAGGRLYTTTMATLILEGYYRHLTQAVPGPAPAAAAAGPASAGPATPPSGVK